ncbi:MAG: bifunctional aspartate kinase/homoserine dehydrogenase I, partial [Paramuribaculum sp.]|nr:bifunctional aspartate kinase/homoserine dehydrogenase I [Paramuribaculum sp.]
HYLKLKSIARNKDVKYLFETNVGAGLPIINTINSLINSGDRILRIEAVLSGTLNFIFNELSKDISFSAAIRGAMDAGYSEPDPRIDLSGTDVMRKLVILAREAGYRIEMEDIKINPLLSEELFHGSVEHFLNDVVRLDTEFEKKRADANQKGLRFRFVACLDNGNATVGLEAIAPDHPFYNLAGSNNVILITTERYHDYPMVIKGYGAGAEVTAAGVFADIISIANIR